MIYTAIHREPTERGQIIRFDLLPVRDMRADSGPPSFDRGALTIEGIAQTARHYATHPGEVSRFFHVDGVIYDSLEKFSIANIGVESEETPCSI